MKRFKKIKKKDFFRFIFLKNIISYNFIIKNK